MAGKPAVHAGAWHRRAARGAGEAGRPADPVRRGRQGPLHLIHEGGLVAFCPTAGLRPGRHAGRDANLSGRQDPEHGHGVPELDEPRRAARSPAVAVALPPSPMTLGGLLKHLAYLEDYWFAEVVAGGPVPEPWASADFKADPDWDWHSAALDPGDDLRALWTERVSRSCDIVKAQLSQSPRPGSPRRMFDRWRSSPGHRHPAEGPGPARAHHGGPPLSAQLTPGIPQLPGRAVPGCVQAGGYVRCWRRLLC